MLELGIDILAENHDLCMAGNFKCFFLSSADFFFNFFFSKNSFRNSIKLSN